MFLANSGGCGCGGVSGGRGDGNGVNEGREACWEREGKVHPITVWLSINWSFNAAQQTKRQLDRTPNEARLSATLFRGRHTLKRSETPTVRNTRDIALLPRFFEGVRGVVGGW